MIHQEHSHAHLEQLVEVQDKVSHHQVAAVVLQAVAQQEDSVKAYQQVDIVEIQ